MRRNKHTSHNQSTHTLNHRKQSHDYRYSGCSLSNPAIQFQLNTDAISNTLGPPKVIKHTYTHTAKHTHVLNYLINSSQKQPFNPPSHKQPKRRKPYIHPDRPPVEINHMDIALQQQQPGLQCPQGMDFNQAHITAVGTKTASSNQWCFVLTLLIGCCMVWPWLLMCCMCWKRHSYPKYEVDNEFYTAIGVFLGRFKACRVLRLSVTDNGFNRQKANLLRQSLSEMDLLQFQFVNLALACNYKQDQADNFKNNVGAIKQLGFRSVLSWGNMTV